MAGPRHFQPFALRLVTLTANITLTSPGVDLATRRCNLAAWEKRCCARKGRPVGLATIRPGAGGTRRVGSRGGQRARAGSCPTRGARPRPGCLRRWVQSAPVPRSAGGGPERSRPPGEHEPAWWFPNPYLSDLGDLAIGMGLGDAPADAWFDGQPPGGLAAGWEQTVGTPPLADLGGEGLEDQLQRCPGPQRHQNPGGHRSRSTWAFRAVN